MDKSDVKTGIKPYAIQLDSLHVRELSIRANIPPDPRLGVDNQEWSIRTGSSPYNAQDKTISVGLRFQCGTDPNETEAPFRMEIEIVGFFQVDEDLFPVKLVSDWARRNAPFVLYPYLREHAFNLSSRCGFKPLLLPLFEIPTFKVEQPKTRSTKRKTNPE